MSAITTYIFILIFMTVYAFVPPIDVYHEGNAANKGIQQQNGSLKGVTGTFLPLLLSDGSSELKSNGGQKIIRSLDTTDFKSMKQHREHVVDRTNLIAEFMNDAHAHVMITRPRGFGKSLSLSMLYHFLNINGNSTDLFKDTSIAKKRDICRMYQNQYPVIRLSFEEMRNRTTWKELDILFRKFFTQMYADFPNIAAKNQSTVREFCKCLYNHFKKKVIILIDDYDWPIHIAYQNGYYDKMINRLKSLYLNIFNNNPFVHKSLIMGVSGIDKEEVISKIDLASYTMLVDKRYSSYFGFSPFEVGTLMGIYYKLDSDACLDMLHYYGYYLVDGKWLANPYLTMQFFKNNGKIKKYWMDTDSDFVKLMNDGGVVPLFESEVLLTNASINRKCYARLTYPAIKKDLNAFWTLVTDFGYVTAAKNKQELLEGFNCRLYIQSKDAATKFRGYVDKCYTQYEEYKHIIRYSECTKIILSQNSPGSIACLKSYFDHAVHYFSAVKVSDPLIQMEIFTKTIIEGLRQYYEKVELRYNNWEGLKNVFVAELTGGRGVPMKILVAYFDDADGKRAINVKPVLTLFFQYTRLYTHIQFEYTYINNNLLLYSIANSNGGLMKQVFNGLDQCVFRPVKDVKTKLKACLKRFWDSILG